jgi:hypothetical protein
MRQAIFICVGEVRDSWAASGKVIRLKSLVVRTEVRFP